MATKLKDNKIEVEEVVYDPDKVTEETMALEGHGEFAKQDGRGDN